MGWFFAFLVFLGRLNAGEQAQDDFFNKQKFIFVSLGSACDVAMAMQVYGIRFAAFPLDWLLILDTRDVALLLDEDFKFFLSEEHFEKHSYLPYAIVNNHYHFDFRHDWKEGKYDFLNHFFSYRKQLPEIGEKYNRRINRFKQLGSYEGKVFFVRAAIDFDADAKIAEWATKEQRQVSATAAMELRDALKKYFPSLDFTLAVINYEDTLPEKIKTDQKNIVEFKCRRTSKYNDFYQMFDALINDQ